MEAVFLACFLFGTVFTLVTAVLGVGHHGLDAGHAHVGGHHGFHGAADDHPLFILNLSTLIGFLTWFGAVGYLLLHMAGWALLPALVVAVALGVAVAMLIGWFVAKIRAGDREMKPADYRIEGTVAKVTVSIPADGVGEIVFTLADSRRSEAARGESGQAIARETEVAIVGYDKGVATVVPWSELLTGGNRS
jgi:membrane protein implicated in regulation of membrane protease activity